MSELKVDKVSPRTGNYVALNTVGSKNIIINGDMNIAQRSTSETGVTGGGYLTCDRWVYERNSSLPTLTFEQATDAPDGFDKSFKLTNTSTDTLASTDIPLIAQRIEGQNLQYLKYGTSDAESLTVSFYVKSSATGNMCVGLERPDGSNNYISSTYTINSANTWEKKSITFSGYTSTAIPNDNTEGLALYFVLSAGTDYTSGSSNSWGTNTNRAVGQTIDFAGTSSATWQITGVQLEAGTTASDFEFLPYDVNLQRCQRYYNLLVSGSGSPICIGSMYSSSALHGVIDLPTSMRVRPSIDQVTGTGYYTVYRNSGTDAFNSLVINFSGTGTENIINFVNETEISGTAGQAGLIVTSNSASYFAVDAEL